MLDRRRPPRRAARRPHAVWLLVPALLLPACQGEGPPDQAADAPGEADAAPRPTFATSEVTRGLGLPFSEVARHGNLLLLSGMVGVRPGTTELVEGGLEAEARRALENLRLMLAEVGARPEDVLRCTVMMDDIGQWGRFNDIYVEFFGDHRPARSAFGADGLALGAAVEIQCTAAAPAGREAPFRVAVARFSHETCTFCPGDEADVEAWTRVREPFSGRELLEEGGAYVEGFVARARSQRDVELVGLTSPAEVWGGSSRSWNTREAFDHFVDRMLADLREAMPVDGVYLALHGAMAVRGVPRPEAEIARRFREVVGEEVPIVATFDLHGNEDGRFLAWADGAFTTKRYPHYDARRQGERAAHVLREVMRGAYEPVTASRKPPVLTATVLQWTGQSPAMDIMERARRWEDREPGAYVSVFFGFPWSDAPDVGAAVHVMTDGDPELADRIADDVADYVWRVREGFAGGDFPGPEEAVRRTRAAVRAGETPVVLAEYWDRPGDATWTLRELLEQDVGGVLYASLTAEPALDRIWAEDLRPGDPFEGEVGGYTGEQAGAPVAIRGTLAWRGERWGYDRVAAVDIGDGSTLILVPAYQQTITPEELRFGPIDPDAYDVFVSKTRVHFRRGFDETGYARTIQIVDAPGDWFGTVRLDALDYEQAPIHRLYPFGDPGAWRGRPVNPGVEP